MGKMLGSNISNGCAMILFATAANLYVSKTRNNLVICAINFNSPTISKNITHLYIWFGQSEVRLLSKSRIKSRMLVEYRLCFVLHHTVLESKMAKGAIFHYE